MIKLDKPISISHIQHSLLFYSRKGKIMNVFFSSILIKSGMHIMALPFYPFFILLHQYEENFQKNHLYNTLFAMSILQEIMLPNDTFCRQCGYATTISSSSFLCYYILLCIFSTDSQEQKAILREIPKKKNIYFASQRYFFSRENDDAAVEDDGSLNSKKWRKITWRDSRLFFICLGGGGTVR